MIDVRLVGIVGPPVEPGDLVDACRAAEAGGITAIQLRLKDSPGAEVFRLTEQVLRESKARGILPRQAAVDLSTQRVKRAMSYRRWSVF